MAEIVLVTLNARFTHASLGLRYLHANLGELQSRAEILECVVTERSIDVVEKILHRRPAIVAFGVYIWNVEETERAIAMLRVVAPSTLIVVGGPEVSHETAGQRIVELSDYVVCGQGDVAFARLCQQLIVGERPKNRIVHAEKIDLAKLELPYRLYTDHDVKNRLVYVEASRGCPFKCEFCLSSLDVTAVPFPLEKFLEAMAILYERGVRHFKFIDRTFNLKIETSRRILDFFFERVDSELFLHFELIPDHLPAALKESIARFPEGSLQFEIGVQTFNPQVQARISRRQDNEKVIQNLQWLLAHSKAHLHVDLIIGLPGETIESIAQGFNQLVALNVHEIQVGILKRLRGAPIARHTEAFDLRYNPHAPYNLLASNALDFETMRRLDRFARYWDLIGNSGRFVSTRQVILGEAPFERFLKLCDWLFSVSGQTHQIALPRLFTLLRRGLVDSLQVSDEIALPALFRDAEVAGLGDIFSGTTAQKRARAVRTTLRQKRFERGERS